MLFPPENLGSLKRSGWDGSVKFRGMTVEAVLAERAARHFEQVSFSKIEQLESHLRSIGIRTGPFGKYFEYLSGLIERRHKIVHNADFESQDLSQRPSPLDPNLVKRWRETVQNVIALLVDTASEKL